MEINIFNLVIKSVALKHAIIRKQVNGTLQNSSILRNAALMLQYYFTVSGNFFPTLCLHILFISCISSSFFWKKLEEIPFFQFLPFFQEETYFFQKFPNPATTQIEKVDFCTSML